MSSSFEVVTGGESVRGLVTHVQPVGQCGALVSILTTENDAVMMREILIGAPVIPETYTGSNVALQGDIEDDVVKHSIMQLAGPEPGPASAEFTHMGIGRWHDIIAEARDMKLHPGNSA